MLDAIYARLSGSLGALRLRRLHHASVAVIGAGLLGGQLLHHLAMLQIRTLLVEPGDVDPENLGNQLVPAAALGEPKASVRVAQMQAINPSCPVRAIRARVEDVGLGSFASCDLILTGLDGQASRLAVNRIAGRLGIDWIDAAVDGSGQQEEDGADGARTGGTTGGAGGAGGVGGVGGGMSLPVFPSVVSSVSLRLN